LPHGSQIAVALLVVFVSLLPVNGFATPLAQQGNFKVSVAGTAPGSIPHDIALKVTQIPGGQLSETTGFAISPESVVQVKQGENIMVTTSENLKVHDVKARNVQGQQVDLMPLPNNRYRYSCFSNIRLYLLFKSTCSKLSYLSSHIASRTLGTKVSYIPKCVGSKVI
jgi:hypothetical protein